MHAQACALGLEGWEFWKIGDSFNLISLDEQIIVNSKHNLRIILLIPLG